MINRFLNTFRSTKYSTLDVAQKYKEEIKWWDEVLKPTNRAQWMEDAIKPETRNKQSPPKLLEFIAELNLPNIPRVLDVGSGPLSPLAWGVDQQLIEVIAIDPLAYVYRDILLRFDIDYPIKPIYGVGEKVTKMFKKGYFDVIYTRNAIDHSDSPFSCIKNMVTVLKDGGILYTEGFQNEGTRNNWRGLHHWNLSIKGNDLICSDMSGNTRNITERLPLKCIFMYGPDANDWYRIAFRRLNKSQ